MGAMLQIKKALPKLQIFNARPVDKDSKNEKGEMVDGVHDFSVDHEGQNLRDSTKEKKSARFHPIGQNEEDHLEAAGDVDLERKSSKKRKKTLDVSKKEVRVLDEENTRHNKDKAYRKKDGLIATVDPDMVNKSATKKRKKDDKPLDMGLAVKENVSRIEKKPTKKQKNEEQSELDVLDDAEASFMELFKIEDAENLSHGGEMKVQDKVPKDMKAVSSTVTSFVKHKNVKWKNTKSLSYPLEEIGIGGPSTWGDE